MNRLNAPMRNPRKVQKEVPLWKEMRENEEVSEAVAFYTPDDIDEIDDVETLKKLYLMYSFIDRTPSDADGFYMRGMNIKIMKKLNDLRVWPPYEIDGFKFRYNL